MRYRAILAAGAARIEPYNARNDPTVTGYPSIDAAIHALGAYTEPVTVPDGRQIIPREINYPYP